MRGFEPPNPPSGYSTEERNCTVSFQGVALRTTMWNSTFSKLSLRGRAMLHVVEHFAKLLKIMTLCFPLQVVTVVNINWVRRLLGFNTFVYIFLKKSANNKRAISSWLRCDAVSLLRSVARLKVFLCSFFIITFCSYRAPTKWIMAACQSVLVSHMTIYYIKFCSVIPHIKLVKMIRWNFLWSIKLHACPSVIWPTSL